MDYTQYNTDSYQMDPNMYATQPQQTAALMAFFLAYWIVILAVYVVVVIGLWKTFVKAGRPGWAALIPFYNIYVLLKIVGKPGWWLILFFIPLVGLIVHILVSLRLAKAFGKSDVFGIFLLWLFGPIGFLILGFGSAKYNKSAAMAK